MSDTGPGEGWWLASDGNWYPPERTPRYSSAPPSQPESFSPFRWNVILGGLIVILIGVAVVIPITASSSPSNSFTGPPSSEPPVTIVAAVNLRQSDVPAQWRSDHGGGQCIASGPGSNPQAPYCGNGPLPGLDQQANDNTYAHCLGVPVSQVSMLTGNDEPGEPPTYSSSTYTAPGDQDSITSEPPSALMDVTVEQSATATDSDINAVASSNFITCTTTWFRHNPDLNVVKGIAGAAGEGLQTTVSIHRAFVTTVPGVRAVAYHLDLHVSIGGKSTTTTAESIALGSGRIEAVLTLQSPQSYPSGAGSTLISRVEGRMARQAAS